jgi:hypothetical protein
MGRISRVGVNRYANSSGLGMNAERTLQQVVLCLGHIRIQAGIRVLQDQLHTPGLKLTHVDPADSTRASITTVRERNSQQYEWYLLFFLEVVLLGSVASLIRFHFSLPVSFGCFSHSVANSPRRSSSVHAVPSVIPHRSQQ